MCMMVQKSNPLNTQLKWNGWVMKMKVKSLMLGDLVYDSPFFPLFFVKLPKCMMCSVF